jgi:hypothetical protein
MRCKHGNQKKKERKKKESLVEINTKIPFNSINSVPENRLHYGKKRIKML